MVHQTFVAALWATFEYAWYPLLLLLITPLLLASLGAEQYGQWMLLTATVGVGSLLNTGTGAATIKAVSSRLDASTAHSVDRAIQSSLAIALTAGTILAGAISGFFWILGPELLHKMGSASVIRITGIAAAALIWLENIDNVFASALRGAELFKQNAQIEIVAKTTQAAGSVALATLCPDITALFLLLIFIGIVRLFSRAFTANALLKLQALRPSLRHSDHLLSNAKWGWLQGLGGLLFGVIDRFAIGSLVGATALAHYSVALQLAQQIHAVCASAFSVLFPKLSRALTKDDNYALRKPLQRALLIVFSLTTPIAALLALGSFPVLDWWLGRDIAAESARTLSILAIAYWVLALNVVPHFVLLAMGEMKFVALSNLAGGLALVTAAFTLAGYYGIVGAAVARVVYGLVISANFAYLMFLLSRHRSRSNGN